jgi:hypothetical protein
MVPRGFLRVTSSSTRKPQFVTTFPFEIKAEDPIAASALR